LRLKQVLSSSVNKENDNNDSSNSQSDSNDGQKKKTGKPSYFTPKQMSVQKQFFSKQYVKDLNKRLLSRYQSFKSVV
jgi:hypothetical protein